MGNTISYITKENERWDTIAFEAYGSADMMNVIIAANPDVPVDEKLPAGIELQIPVIAETAVTPDASLLPPWKRNL